MKSTQERRPKIACEFKAGQVAVAHAGEGGAIDLSATRLLPPGALTPRLTGTNIPDRGAVKASLEEALASIPRRAQDVMAIVPDVACRIVLLDFDALPESRAESETLIRLRLKKSLPFEIEKARVSWQAQQSNGKPSVLAAVALGSVLQEYESLLTEAGYNPGMVLPSILASLRQVEATVPTLVIGTDSVAASLAVASDRSVLLLRVLDLALHQQPQGAQLAEDVYTSMVFFQDTYGAKVQRILVDGLAAFPQLEKSLAEATGVHPEELTSAAGRDDFSQIGSAGMGEVLGALA